jgi:hypothetical protein
MVITLQSLQETFSLGRHGRHGAQAGHIANWESRRLLCGVQEGTVCMTYVGAAEVVDGGLGQHAVVLQLRLSDCGFDMSVSSGQWQTGRAWLSHGRTTYEEECCQQ